MAQWELTSKLGPFLDRHLVIPLLEFLSVNGKGKQRQALFLDIYHAFYAFDFSEKLSFGLFELSFLQNN